MTEAELAAIIVSAEEAQGADVYQEVRPDDPLLDQVADIVSVYPGGDLVVIEVKTALTLDLIAQASAWVSYAHGVEIATPDAIDTRGRDLARREILRRGLGWRTVSQDGTLRHEITARRNPAPKMPLLAQGLSADLRAHKKAGTPGGKAKTSTLERLRPIWEAVANYPQGIRASALYREIGRETAFIARGGGKSAWISQIIREAEAGRIPHVTAFSAGGLTTLHPLK